MLVIGEKINGTREKVARAIADRDAALIQRLALVQVAAGADYLDINTGTHPRNEPADMTWLIRTVQQVADVPLCLDSANPVALRAGLDEVDRLPMINSLSGEKRRLENVLPLATEHGTPLVLLALDDAGIPKSADSRLTIIERLVAHTRQAGLADDQLYVDPLVKTIATDRSSATVAFDAMQKIKTRFPGVHLTCGLSNISFGQPLRSTINQAFAALAIYAGLDCAIIDPEDKRLMGIILATEMLLGMDPNCLKFNAALRAGLIDEAAATPPTDEGRLTDALRILVEAMTAAGLLDAAGGAAPPAGPLRKPPPEVPATEAAGEDVVERLIKAMVDMREAEVLDLTEAHLASGGDPLALLEASRRAMVRVGEMFEKHEYFVPELMLAGEMLAQIATAVKPYLGAGQQGGEKKGRVLIGTVEGDIHDIGKDIVATLLDINGFEVLDLGVDVPAERFVSAALEFKPQVVGLSGFLTLAYEPMKKIIAALREALPDDTSYMIGGGQMDDQVAAYVRADAFGKDALEAVKLCDRWIASDLEKTAEAREDLQ